MSAVLPHLEITPQRPHWLAGAPGFEPGNGGIKIRCPTTCLRVKARAIGILFLLAAKLSERRRLRGRLITLVSDQDALAIVLRGERSGRDPAVCSGQRKTPTSFRRPGS